jgi:hypothetical protein
MRERFTPSLLPNRAVLITCSSHEGRCRSLLAQLQGWKPKEAVLFHYDDVNPRREVNHEQMVKDLRAAAIEPTVLQFTEGNPVKSLHDNMQTLRRVFAANRFDAIVLDISVFTKRHLFMMLRWLDDEELWEQLAIAYSEPAEYVVSEFIPLSSGLASVQQVPGFSACPDLSRPVHLVLFLGYEGDRALAVYEHVQPMRTTLIVPDPPYKPYWRGRTEQYNADLLALVGDALIENVDAIDPDQTKDVLTKVLGDSERRGTHARIICPLGTKPQAIGIYSYLRECADPPAVIYASPIRHNHEFFSHGVGATWVLKQATTT